MWIGLWIRVRGHVVGDAVNWLAVSRDFELTATEMQQAKESGFPAQLVIALPKTPTLRLVTAVYDWTTSRSGSLSIRISQ